MYSNDDDELERFKQKVNIAELARTFGYTLDERSQRTSYRMKNASNGSKIIVATGQDGHGIFFDTQGSASGSVLDFVMWQKGISLGYARKFMREYTGQHNFTFPPAGAYEKPQPMSRDRAGVFSTWAAMKPYRHGYLEGRALAPRTISKFADAIRTDQRGNTCFLHEDSKGVAGYEIKNRGFTGYAAGGRKALFTCHITEQPDEPPALIAIAEAAIDVMSFYQMNPAAGLYISIAGTMSPEQRGQLTELLASNPQARVLIATDKDKQGEAYADFIRSVRPDAERAAPPIGKDWNDSLNQRAERAR